MDSEPSEKVRVVVSWSCEMLLGVCWGALLLGAEGETCVGGKYVNIKYSNTYLFYSVWRNLRTFDPMLHLAWPRDSGTKKVLK